MKNGDNKDLQAKLEDAFYQTEYDEDTIDYELDSDKLLEEEYFELEDEESTAKVAESSYDPEFEQPSGVEVDSEYELEPEEEWYDDEPEEGEQYSDSWPLSLIAVGIVALLLLAAGGYGVLQQRTAMQEEIRQLRATLATTTSNLELSASRQAQRGLVSHNEELSSQLELLQSENQKLKEQLASDIALVPAKPTSSPMQEPATPVKAKPVSPKKLKAKPSTVVKQQTKPKNVPTLTPAAPAEGNWFVNFGSYSQRPMADHWAAKLSVAKGRIVVLPGNKSGTQYFRVRVIDLPNREIAGKIARQLEKTYKLPRLWVGEQ